MWKGISSKPDLRALTHWAVLPLPLAQEWVSTSNWPAFVLSSPTSSVRRRTQGGTGEPIENTWTLRQKHKASRALHLVFIPRFRGNLGHLEMWIRGRLHQPCRSCWTSADHRVSLMAACQVLLPASEWVNLQISFWRMVRTSRIALHPLIFDDLYWFVSYFGSIFLYSGWLRLGVVDFKEILSRWDEKTEGSAWDS